MSAGAGWRAAVQRTVNAYLDYMLTQMKACSQWYAQAAGLAHSQNSHAQEIPDDAVLERRQGMPATSKYPGCGNTPEKHSANAGNSDIPIVNIHHYRQNLPATNSYHAKHSAAQRGFSLLEIMVAFSIMAMSLGLLYRITGSSARQVGSVQQHEQAMALAASVLDTVPAVPEQGLEHSDAAAGYEWAIATRPWATPHNELGTVPRLHEVQVTVSWQDGERVREFTLTTLRPERLPEQEP